MKTTVLSALLSLAAAAALGTAQAERRNVFTMEATAYTIKGEQAAGTASREGTAAADPDILPLGSRVRVSDRKGLIGEFVITDTGEKVQGPKIDIYFKSPAEARKFGRKRVRVQVLEWGAGPESAREEASEGLSRPRHPGEHKEP